MSKLTPESKMYLEEKITIVASRKEWGELLVEIAQKADELYNLQQQLIGFGGRPDSDMLKYLAKKEAKLRKMYSKLMKTAFGLVSTKKEV
jgi:hypothetical protein